MWLIHTIDLVLKEFHTDALPPYAILSHRWDDDPSNEVTFQELRKSRAKSPIGMKKIYDFCRAAEHDEGLVWAWVDTCCIDKKSSAHLSEAINSMYRYYEQAQVCYVYLNDVRKTEANSKTWQESRWWTRGWTLQELLAAPNVRFYDANWQLFGDKHQLKDEIAAMTGISVFMIEGGRHELASFTAGQRLSWAASRRTTRSEDRAYSLLGLLGIFMPLLYGERERAFIRLQQEILSSSADESILAWSCVHPSKFISLAINAFVVDDWQATSVLAENPDSFQKAPDTVLVREFDPVASQRHRPPSVTSWGLKFTTRARQLRANEYFYNAVFSRAQASDSRQRMLAPPLLVVPLVVPDVAHSLALSCVLILAPMLMRGRYGRLCCVAARFTTLDSSDFYKPFFDLDDLSQEMTLYLKT